VSFCHLCHCSVIFDRLGKNGRNYEESTRIHLAQYGDAGLRTLALAYRTIKETEYSEWNATFSRAKTTIGADREALLDSASDLIEKDLILVGATAIEDKLQKGVGTAAPFIIRILYSLFI
jgi:phospholipid-translocating ATPase